MVGADRRAFERVRLLAVTALLVGGALFWFSSEAWIVVILLTLPCPPGVIAMAMLRSGLWDLDRLVSRTIPTR